MVLIMKTGSISATTKCVAAFAHSKNEIKRLVACAMALAVALGFGLLAPRSAHAQTFTLLYGFTGGSDGSGPEAPLLEVNGHFYGTTSGGGADGYGTIFEVIAPGVEKVLYSFCAKTGCLDGSTPVSGLVVDTEGNFYGTTQYGGKADQGTVFKLTSAHKETVLHSFEGEPDGALPHAGLVIDAEGNLYGTTGAGGDFGFGTVFKVTSAGEETVLHSFADTDGWFPLAGLVMDSAVNLYGTTELGGANGYGAVFEVTNAGKEGVVYSFTGGKDEGVPVGGLVMGKNHILYGTTTGLGDGEVCDGISDCGTVFELNGKKLSTVYTFSGGADGGDPEAALVIDGEGNLYGTTCVGGANGSGTVFEVTGKKEKVLYSFTGGEDSSCPQYAPLIMDSKGNLYGTASGGENGGGSVFEVKP
jgi:uncharacterized repeat protein (TIGR03803 family)